MVSAMHRSKLFWALLTSTCVTLGACASDDELPPVDAAVIADAAGTPKDMGAIDVRATTPDTAVVDAGTSSDTPQADASVADSAAPDSGSADATPGDGATPDATASDSLTADAAPADSAVDSAVPDTATPDTTPDTATPDTATPDTATPDTATADTATADTATPDTAPSFTLKVENYASWCSVSVNGATANATEVQMFTFPAGTVVNLHSTALNGTFVWGYWVGTASDTTGSHDTHMTTTVTVTKNQVIQACCPLASAPTDPCPAPTP
jgi:hypothetical protein